MFIQKDKFFKNFPYDTIRKEQQYVLDKIYDNYDTFRYFIIEAPTGTGKSAIAKTLMDSVNKNMLLTSTKYLQQQYENEFKDLFSMKGQANYPCTIDNEFTCGNGPCKFNQKLMSDCILNNSCEYFNNLKKIKNINSFVTSYSFFLFNNLYFKSIIDQNKLYDLMILDECHLLENNLISDVGFKININKLNDKYNILENLQFDKFIKITSKLEEGFEKNKEFLSIVKEILENKIKEYSVKLNNLNSPINKLDAGDILLMQSIQNGLTELKSLLKKITNLFFNKNVKDWVVEPVNDTLYLQPINIEQYFLNKIDKFAKKFVFLSASILDIDGYIKDLGIPKNQVLKIKVPSTFDYRKSPIISFPSGKMNYQNIDNSMPTIIKNIKIILNQHKGEKGIIHTNNYKITKEIIDQINDPRLIYTNDDTNNEQLLEIHSNSKKDTVIISPSLSTGADLKDELARFQIIIKLPFLSLGDRRINKKSKINPQWYNTEMFKTLVQMCGRSTRHNKDYSVTYILDNSFYYYVSKNISILNKSFVKRIIFNKDNFNLNKYKKFIEGEIDNE